jgi:hypothetical protein
MGGEAPPGLEIRAASRDDVPALARVHIASWRAAYPHILPAEVLAALSWVFAPEVCYRLRLV